MKNVWMAALVCGLAVTWVGCESATDPAGTIGTSATTDGASSDLTLVTLKVPNMT